MAESGLVDGYGLISALPPLYWAGVVIGVVSTFVLLWVSASNERSPHATAVPVMWLLLLHTAPQLAHAHPRQPIAWTHLGLLRLIDESGTVEVSSDARLAWPAFHGAFLAPLAELDGWASEAVLRLWPSLITGSAAILVAALARRSYPTVRLIGTLAALMYILLAWMGQDYFSPQSVGFLWYLAILVLLESGPLQTGSAWSAAAPFLSRFATLGGDRPESRSTPAFVALVILGLGSVVAHPMAPLFVCIALAVFGLYGRSMAWRLLLLVSLACIVWFLLAAQPWWGDGPGSLTRPFTGVLDETSSNLGRLGDGGSVGYQFVSRMRLYITLSAAAAMMVAGLVMSGDRFRHLRPAVPLIPLAAATAVIVPLVAPTGASIVQVLVFTLPLTAILVSRMLASLRVSTLPIVVAVTAAGLAPVLLVTRYGGEPFEFTLERDRAAVQAAYESADDDTLFVADNPSVPWRDQTVGRNSFTELSVERSQDWVNAVEAEADRVGKRRAVVVLTEGQRGWTIHRRGLPAETLDEFAEWLLDLPGSELLCHEEGSWAIEL